MSATMLAAGRSVVWQAVFLGFVLGIPACSGGGGSGGGDAAIALVDLQFPDPSGQSGGNPAQSPEQASLVQQAVFVFDGAPDPGSVSAQSLQVKDAANFPVDGDYRLQGNRVTFTPRLPTRPLVMIDEESFDTGGCALSPNQSYFVEVVVGTTSSIKNLRAIEPALAAKYPHPSTSLGVLAGFDTTNDPELFFTGLDVAALDVVSVTPADGTLNFAPHLKSDPGSLFGENRPIDLFINGPIDPSVDNVSDARFRLIDLDDPGEPKGLSLGVDVTILENGPDGCSVRLAPHGILAFGHMLLVEAPATLRHLSDSISPPGDDSRVVAVIKVEEGPQEEVSDRVVQPFDDRSLYDDAASRSLLGTLPAQWDENDQDLLQAAVSFPGTGELGRFIPADLGDPRIIRFDTAVQRMPLFDGSTPDAAPGTVYGGVFHFTDVIIPNDIIIQAVGANPLIFTATGRVEISGTIDLRGENGTSDSSYDSAVLPIPGGHPGPGGGRGGDSHPTVFYPPDSFSLMSQISPTKGADGQAPSVNEAYTGPLSGGVGGLTLISDDPGKSNPEIDCNEFGGEEAGRGAHGGGGTFLALGIRGFKGGGNMNPQPDCTWDDLGTYEPPGGKGGPSPFRDGNRNNNFIGVNGDLKFVQGGQGGGGGGSKNEGYYCGFKLPWGRNEFNYAFPDTTGDARGGGGGGSGGALGIEALGAVLIKASARFYMTGGVGGGGEVLGGSSWGGGGGGGSGGALIVRSADGIHVLDGARFELLGGFGNISYKSGSGGNGILQLQVPFGQTAVVDDQDLSGFVPPEAWVDTDNQLNPVEFSPRSNAVSQWIDLGRVIARPPDGANPRFEFNGTDAKGAVITDFDGFINEPHTKPFEIHYLGQIDPLTRDYYEGEEPRANWIPPKAEIFIEFQAADAIAEGSKEVDPETITNWNASITVADGRQFVRFRVTFDLTANGGQISSRIRRPVFKNLELGFQF